jgi:hypothetical protein
LCLWRLPGLRGRYDLDLQLKDASLKPVLDLLGPSDRPTYVALAIAVVDILESGRSTRMFCFHNSNERAALFERLVVLVAEARATDLSVSRVWGSEHRVGDERFDRMPSADRVGIFRAFALAERSVLVSCRAAQEGVDCPACDACLLVDPRSSPENILQIIGRAMRPASGKDFGTLYLPLHLAPEQFESWERHVEEIVSLQEAAGLADTVGRSPPQPLKKAKKRKKGGRLTGFEEDSDGSDETERAARAVAGTSAYHTKLKRLVEKNSYAAAVFEALSEAKMLPTYQSLARGISDRVEVELIRPAAASPSQPLTDLVHDACAVLHNGLVLDGRVKSQRPDAFLISLRSLADWYREHPGQEPRESKTKQHTPTAAERRVANWLREQRKQHRMGALPGTFDMALREKVGDQWHLTVDDRTWLAKVEKIRSAYQHHGGQLPPSKDEDSPARMKSRMDADKAGYSQWRLEELNKLEEYRRSLGVSRFFNAPGRTD